MADLEVLGRRLTAIIEKKRPDIGEGQREEIVRWVMDNLDVTDDLTAFWCGFYGAAL